MPGGVGGHAQSACYYGLAFVIHSKSIFPYFTLFRCFIVSLAGILTAKVRFQISLWEKSGVYARDVQIFQWKIIGQMIEYGFNRLIIDVLSSFFVFTVLTIHQLTQGGVEYGIFARL